jgi:hypothetical protein
MRSKREMSAENDPDAYALPEFRDRILQRGWKDSAEFITHDIEFVADLCLARQLYGHEIVEFNNNVQIAINTLRQVQEGTYEEETRRLYAAVQSFNRAQAYRRDISVKDVESERWSLFRAMAWCEHLDQSLQVFELCCNSWRPYLVDVSKEHQAGAINCIEEIEKRIPVFRRTRLTDVPAQKSALEQVVLLNAKLTVYFGHSESLKRFFNTIALAREAAQGERMAAFSTAVFAGDLNGQPDWLDEVDPMQWVQTEARRLQWLYGNDGRLDSNGKIIHERAYNDPLERDADEVRRLGTIDKASFNCAQHPDVRQEIEDLESALKKAGLNPRQRGALLLRRNGDIASRKQVNEWKRSQRAIRRKRSSLEEALSAAVKKRVIKAPPMSAGSFSGVIRDGAGYTFPISEIDQANPRAVNSGAKWFDSFAPPISPNIRKKKHLFKKVST